MTPLNTPTSKLPQLVPQVQEHPRSRFRAAILAVLAMTGTAIVLAVLIAIWSLQYFFSHGGTLGGFGASSEEYFVEPPTADVVFGYCLVGAALLMDIVVGVVVYRRVRRSRTRSVRR